MKQKLKQIFQDLASGKLSQKEALENIRVLKLQNQEESFGTLLATPVWEVSTPSLSSKSNSARFNQQWIVLGELPQVKSQDLEGQTPNSHCVALQTPKKNIADRYS